MREEILSVGDTLGRLQGKENALEQLFIEETHQC